MKIRCPNKRCSATLDIPDIALLDGSCPFTLPDHTVPERSGMLDYVALAREQDHHSHLVVSLQKRCKMSGATAHVIR